MNTPWLPSQQRKYAETDLRELERLLVAAPGPWLRLSDDPDECIRERNMQAAARALIANLRARLPKLLALWDAANNWEKGLGSPMEVAIAVCDLDAPLHEKKEMP